MSKSHLLSPCSNSVKSSRLGSECWRFFSSKPLPFVPDDLPSTSKKQCLQQHQPSSNRFSVCPLYHGNHIPFDESQKNGHKSISNNTIRTGILGGFGNHLASDFAASNKRFQSLKNRDPDLYQTSVGCDLSLKLGPNAQMMIHKDEKLSSFSCDTPSVQKRKADFVCLTV